MCGFHVLLLWAACLLGCIGVLGEDCPAFTIAISEAPPQSTSCATQLQQYAHCTRAGDVLIQACATPFNLNALANLTRAHAILIDSNVGLTSLDGAFPSLVASTTVRINNNVNLLSMTGAFPKLTITVSVEDGTNYQVEVTVGFNSRLQNMSHAFDTLEYISGARVNITIHDNGALTDIDSFHQLTTADRLAISNNQMLRSMHGFTSLNDVRTLWFDELPQLTSIAGIRRLRIAGAPTTGATYPGMAHSRFSLAAGSQ